MIRLHILGCGSATPTPRHLPACQVLEVNSRLLMIDCGEGAAHSMLRQKLKLSRLDHIFLSHLHADHCMGLPGLINTMVMNGRRASESRELLTDILRDEWGYTGMVMTDWWTAGSIIRRFWLAMI